jgi:hypothetical protein
LASSCAAEIGRISRFDIQSSSTLSMIASRSKSSRRLPAFGPRGAGKSDVSV